VTKVEEEPSTQKGADVIDLTELLKRSLQGKPGAAAKGQPAAKPAAQKAPAKAAGKKTASAKSTSRRAA
jgi:DNA end-binding protein Ku